MTDTLPRINRRAFLKTGAMLAGATALAACSGAPPPEAAKPAGAKPIEPAQPPPKETVLLSDKAEREGVPVAARFELLGDPSLLKPEYRMAVERNTNLYQLSSSTVTVASLLLEKLHQQGSIPPQQSEQFNQALPVCN